MDSVADAVVTTITTTADVAVTTTADAVANFNTIKKSGRKLPLFYFLFTTLLHF